MNEKRTVLTWKDCQKRANRIASFIDADTRPRPLVKGAIRIYPVPNGGIPAALLVAAAIEKSMSAEIIDDLQDAHVIIDDIIDSGRTQKSILNQRNSPAPFYALVDKQSFMHRMTETSCDCDLGWVEFPWERMAGDLHGSGVANNIRRILQYIGEDPTREGLLETPHRVEKSYGQLFSGYHLNPADVFKVFEDGACDEMIVLRNIEFYSHCEHHMQPFFGKAHIAYIPNGKVIGISKLARLLEIYSRRLQIQERLCQQITESIMTHLDPLGAACILEAKHFCMVCRGVQKQNSEMITSSLLGAFRQPETRAELFNIIRR